MKIHKSFTVPSEEIEALIRKHYNVPAEAEVVIEPISYGEISMTRRPAYAKISWWTEEVLPGIQKEVK